MKTIGWSRNSMLLRIILQFRYIEIPKEIIKMDNINDRRYFELFNISDKYLTIEEKNDGPNNDDN